MDDAGELKAARPEVLVVGVRRARPLAPGTVALWNGSFFGQIRISQYRSELFLCDHLQIMIA